MSLEVFTQSLSIAETNQIDTLNFFGGEPMLNPQFFPMLRTALERNFSLILATNCRPMVKDEVMTRFLDLTRPYRERVTIVTARDKFHLRYFDPVEIINHLRDESYRVTINDYSDHTVLLSEYNGDNRELRELDNHFSCCNANWKGYLGVLPHGGWTICPVSLETFGDIFTNSLENILRFKRRLPLRYEEGCTRCLKDFKNFREEFETSGHNQKTQSLEV